MNYSSAERLFDQAEYRSALEKTLESILNKCGAATTEATVASVFEMELYHFIKTFFHLDIVFEKEIGQTDLRHEFTGRMDAISNDLIIEYKKRKKLSTDADRKKASEQVIGYLNQRHTETGLFYQAVLTDGTRVRFFYYQNGIIHHTPFQPLDTEILDRLVRSLIQVKNKKFVPENIVQDFKLYSANGHTLKLARCLFRMLMQNMTEKTDMLFQEWQVLFHLSENDRGQNLDIQKRRAVLGKIFDIDVSTNDTDYKALFVLQTTYAIIVKLIACKVISKLAFNREVVYFSDLTQVSADKLREFLEQVEDGYIFAAGGIRNLLEGDFFSWYCTQSQWTGEEASCIIPIISLLEEYTSAAFSQGDTAIDIFKDLYMEIMPNEVRHSLGEYFTPAWLADYVVEQSAAMTGKTEEWKGIDPCCGSGVFVIAMVRRILGQTDLYSLSRTEKNVLLQRILRRAHGIDINPLSVLTARVSYLLAISPLLTEQKVEIPIYLGDSANIPQKTVLDDVMCYEYTVNTKQGDIHVVLPCGFVRSPSFLEKMSLLQNLVRAENEHLVYERLADNIGEEAQRPAVRDALMDLSACLTMLHRKNWDGIWIRIVTNYMMIARLEQMDIIVGNPPWIKWEFLPQMYAEKIKALCLDRHLFSGQTYMGAISLNICALIANVTASSWLSESGVLAFLMPKTLMTQDSYAGFRNFYMDTAAEKRLYLQKADDWSKAGNPFLYTQEKFLTYYYRHNPVDYTDGIPVRFMEKKKGQDIRRINWHNRFEEVEHNFTVSDGAAYQLDTSRTGFTMLAGKSSDRIRQFRDIIGKCDYKARSGVEFTPAEVYFIEPSRQASTANTYVFHHSAFKNAVYKATAAQEFELETKYIRPVVKGPYIEEFRIRPSDNYCIFPYDHVHTESVPLERLSSECPYLTDYLLRNKALIGRQSKRSLMIAKGNDFYSLSKVGKYTFADYAVAFRDNTKLTAAVVTPIETPWGTKEMPVCAKHSPYISMDCDGGYITEEEAYYLCAVLNTNIVQEYYQFTYSGRSYSIALNIKLPKYDPHNRTHQKLAQLARKAHAACTEEQTARVKEQAEALYLSLCREN